MKTCLLSRLEHVHCRVGSLESKLNAFLVVATVHCRVGSLENNVRPTGFR